MLGVEGVVKRFGSLLALDDVSFSAQRGQILGLLGPNGAGKTTTMRAIMHLVALDRGAVTWDGSAISAEMRSSFGYMPAERGMYPRMKVRDHLVYYSRLSGTTTHEAGRSADEWIERLGLGDRRDATVESLSSGNQQRVQLALALLGEPEVLILDEPFSGLDPVAVENLSDVLREQAARGAAVLLSSHQLDLVADVCRSVVIIDRGRVVLRGDVASLRAASGIRHIDVEFAAPTIWTVEAPAEVSDDGRRHRVTVDRNVDPHGLIDAAHRAGTVVAFSFASPDLSEVFLRSLATAHGSAER
ncbi:MAG: ABC transporter ATP-binding protein [Acidimicrobiia bacterium]